MLLLLFPVLFITTLNAATTYYIGAQGDDCYHTCYLNGANCNAHVATNNSYQIFVTLGINCQPDTEPWWAEDQPSYVSGVNDPNYGKCVGYVNVPDGIQCGASYPTTRRLCACSDPDDSSSVAAFGTGLSAGMVTTNEQTIFTWLLPSSVQFGVMTHFWATVGEGILSTTMVRYYIDGETTASIQFIPPYACGVGFGDDHAPWGTKWFGKGASAGSFFHNFKIPFQKSVKITVQNSVASYGGFYMIVRGLPNVPIKIGDFSVPTNAKLLLQKYEKVAQPLEWVPIADVPSGNGLFFMQSLIVQSNNLNFLEGCYHQYSPYNQAFPGTVLSTGTEDYFDSGWYFDAGPFWLPVSGMTHLDTQNGAHVSMYRFHEMDPLPFSNGFLLHWRNGDMTDDAGRKCFVNKGGNIVGSPGPSNVTAYGWVYVWN